MIKWLRSLEVGIEELILFLLIILNILDFLEILPGDLDYVKKIVSWIILGILLYKLSLINIFFGKKESKEELSEALFGIRNRDIDALILIAYFSFIIKNLIGFAAVAFEESYHLKPFYAILIKNAVTIETMAFYFAGTILILISVYLATKVNIKQPSLMHIIHEEGPPPKRPDKILIRILTIFLVLMGFYIIVFNLMMEWLAMAVDAPLLMVGIFGYLLILVKHAKKFSPSTLVYNLANIGEEFYVKFISLFHYKKTIALGISGLLVLHSLTDIGIYIVPYITGLKDILYFGQLGGGHDSIYQLFLSDSLHLKFSEQVSLGFTYLLNIIAIIAFLLSPAYIWYVMYYNKKVKINISFISLVMSSIMVYFLAPAFKILPIQTSGLMGVDIQTQSLLNLASPILSIIAIGIFILTLALSHLDLRKILLLETMFCLYFFSKYIYLYSTNVVYYYIRTIIYLFGSGHIFIGSFLFIFLTMIVLLYCGGFLLFVYEIWTKFIPRLDEPRT